MLSMHSHSPPTAAPRPQPIKRSDGRLRMLQRYCDDLCLLPEPAQSDLVVEFFWPSGEHGNSSVEAPDGSKACMT